MPVHKRENVQFTDNVIISLPEIAMTQQSGSENAQHISTKHELLITQNFIRTARCTGERIKGHRCNSDISPIECTIPVGRVTLNQQHRMNIYRWQNVFYRQKYQ